MIKSSKPYFPESDQSKICEEIKKLMDTGVLTQGSWVKKFEEEFADYVGAQYGIATNSGTASLEILLRYFQIEGREVIVPTNTFLSTANAVIFSSGIPVLADISPESLCIDPAEIRRKLSQKTKGVIVVHIAGLICPEMDEIRELCNTNGLFLIEDAAHATGASIGNQKAGSLGDGSAFSFYPTKPITTGEGGMITTNDFACDQFARSTRCHGIALQNETEFKNENLLVRLGYNWRMSEIQAIIGYHQLQRLDEMLVRRQQIAQLYNEHLCKVRGIDTISVPPNVKHSYYKFPVILDSIYNRGRILGEMFRKYQIQCGTIYYPPCHLQPFYREKFGYKMGDFPVAENVLDRTLTLPIHPNLTDDQISEICDAFVSCLKSNN